MDTSEIDNLEGRILQLDSTEPIDISEGGRKVTYKLAAPVSKTCIIKAICPVEVRNAKAKRKSSYH